MKNFLIVMILSPIFSYSQLNCDLFNVNLCNEFIEESNNYFFELKIDSCNEFNFNSSVDKILKEGLINKIITRVDISSTINTSNINGESSSSYKESVSLESSGILFDINYLYCNRNNSNYLIAFVDKGTFNNSSRKSFQNQLISLNSIVDLLYDQLIFKDELTFDDEIKKINQDLLFMDKNFLFLNNLNIENDLVYAFGNLNQFGRLKSKLKYQNMKMK